MNFLWGEIPEMPMIRVLVFMLLVPFLSLTGCGGGGGEGGGSNSTTSATTSVGIRVSPGTTITTNESGLAANISVSLGSKPTADVTIPVNSSDTTEGAVDKSSLIFTSANWSTAQTITVTGVKDTIVDGNQSYTIHLGPATSTDSSYSSLEKFVPAINLDVLKEIFVISPISGNTSESGTKATFTVRLGSTPTADVTIPVQSSNTAEGTVDKPSLTFTSSNWDQNQTVTVTGVADSRVDGNQVYSIKLGPTASSDSVYNNLNPGNVSVTNLDVRTASFVVSPISGNTSESGAKATFTVRLGSQPIADVIISLSSSDTSEGTVDKASLTFTNANWDQDQTVTVTGVADSLADGNQVYSIKLGPTVSTDSVYNNLNPGDISVTNLDVRIPSFVVSKISGNTSESGTTATFTVRLGSPPTANVTIPVKSSDLTEGTVDKSNLTFTTSNWDKDQTVTVTGVDDTVADGFITYPIQLGPTVSTDIVYNNLNPGDVSVTNLDLKNGIVDVINISGNSTDESGRQVTFQVKLHSQPAADVTIPVNSSDTTEGIVDKTSLTFTSSNWATPQTVTVTGVGDQVADGNQNYTINLGLTSSTDDNYNGLDPVGINLTNLDMKTGSFDITAISGNTNGSGLTASFRVRLNSRPAFDVTIPISSSDPSKGTVNPASLTFTGANYNSYQTVTVTGVANGNFTYNIHLGPTTSTDDNFNGLNPGDVAVTNLAVGSFIITAISGNTDESGRQATFQVSLGSLPTADVIIPLSSSDTTEGTVNPASLTFTSINWAAPQTVTVTGVADILADGAQTYTIQLAPAVSTDPAYNGLDPADVTVINLDLSLVVVSGISGNTDESGKSATFTVHLGAQPAADVIIPIISSSDLSEGTVSPTSLTFTNGNWSANQTVTVTGVDDSIADGNQNYLINLATTTSTDPNFIGLVSTPVSVTNVDLVDPYGVTPRISAGYYHNLLLASDGTVWGWGACADGQLDAVAPATCSGTFTLPQRLNISGASAVSAGNSFSVIVKADGTVSTCGANSDGQLGHGGGGLGSPLAPVTGLTEVETVSAGGSHTLALKKPTALANPSTVWAWGNGMSGQLGNGSYGYSSTPVQATGGTFTGKTVTAIAAGAEHSLALDNGKNVYSWGSNSYYQLGQISGTATPTAINLLTNVTAIAAGQQYSLAVGKYSTGTNTTYGWGFNNDYQLGSGGNPKTIPTAVTTVTINPTRLDGGIQHSLALVGTSVYGWGDNDDTEGTIESWDNRGALGRTASIIDSNYPIATFTGVSATDVNAGLNYSLVLLSDGRIQSSGLNNYGQLGTNATLSGGTYTNTPVDVQDPGGTISYYAYRPIISGQPATSTTIKSATISVCASPATAYCGAITYYRYSLDGVYWTDPPTPIATPFTLSNLPLGTVNLWVKGMTSISNAIQTDTSAVKISWSVIAP